MIPHSSMRTAANQYGLVDPGRWGGSMFAGSPTTLLVVDEVLADLEAQQAQLLIDIIDGRDLGR